MQSSSISLSNLFRVIARLEFVRRPNAVVLTKRSCLGERSRFCQAQSSSPNEVVLTKRCCRARTLLPSRNPVGPDRPWRYDELLRTAPLASNAAPRLVMKKALMIASIVVVVLLLIVLALPA